MTANGFLSAVVTGLGFALGALIMLVVWHAFGLPGGGFC